MSSENPASSGVFCDGLSVTFSPDDSPRDDVAIFLQSHGFQLSQGSSVSLDLWRSPDYGLVRFEAKPAHHRCYVSGKAMAHLRGWRAVGALLAEFASQPHRVTLIDAALDVPVDAPAILADLRRKHPKSAPLTRKGLETWWMLGSRDDGAETGTFYVGRRGKSKVQARVYDKQHELARVHGLETGPTTRYEVSVRGELAPTLRDVMEPERMFWHFVSPALLEKPEGVAEWESVDAAAWSHERQAVTPWETLRRRVEESADLGALMRVADLIGPQGRSEMLRLIENRVEATPRPATLGPTAERPSKPN